MFHFHFVLSLGTRYIGICKISKYSLLFLFFASKLRTEASSRVVQQSCTSLYLLTRLNLMSESVSYNNQIIIVCPVVSLRVGIVGKHSVGVFDK